MYKISFRYTHLGSGSTSEGNVLVLAKTHAEAREAFRATHYSSEGFYKIDSVQKFSTVELERLPL